MILLLILLILGGFYIDMAYGWCYYLPLLVTIAMLIPTCTEVSRY